jgi:hypothetical protein
MQALSAVSKIIKLDFRIFFICGLIPIIKKLCKPPLKIKKCSYQIKDKPSALIFFQKLNLFVCADIQRQDFLIPFLHSQMTSEHVPREYLQSAHVKCGIDNNLVKT